MENIKTRLLELQRLLTEAEATGAVAEEVVELDQQLQGRLSRMDAMRAQAMSQATGAQRRQTLREISAALQRFEDDCFGECEECGEAIAPGRLEANPVARTCIDCAAALEQQG